MPPKAKNSNENTKSSKDLSAGIKKLNDYYTVTKRGTIYNWRDPATPTIDDNKSSSYYNCWSKPQSRRVSKEATPSQKSQHSNKSKRREIKVFEKTNNAPINKEQQTPFAFQQPKIIMPQNTGKAHIYYGISNGQTLTQNILQNQQQKQQNMFFKPSQSTVGGCTTRSTIQKSTSNAYKPSNYTVSTDDTTQQQYSQDMPSIDIQQLNKRQRLQRQDQDQLEEYQETNFKPVGEKRPARQCASLGHQNGYTKKTVFSPERIYLEDIKKAEIRTFNVYKDENIFPDIYKNPQFNLINMNIHQKQRECDYETDLDSIQRAKEILRRDLKDALNFFVMNDPLILVNNI